MKWVVLLIGLIMAFNFQSEHLQTIRDHPHLLGHMVGKTKLTEIHSKWIKDVWIKKKPLQAHRGSYKTTAITEVGSLWWHLFHPNDRIGIYRKPYMEAANCIRVIKGFYSIEAIQALFHFAHGIYPSFKQSREGCIIFNFKNTNTNEGSLNAYSIDSVKTGTHLDEAICDDFVTIDDRISKAKRESTKHGLRELITNIMDPGQIPGFVGTPWQKDDGWNLVPGIIKKYTIDDLNILTAGQIAEKRKTTTESLFACNYLLKHIANIDAIFQDPVYGKWNWKLSKVYAHLDAKYKGDHTNGLTIMAQEPDGIIHAIGWTFNEHIDEKIDFVVEKCKKYKVRRMYNEENADKGYLAKELRSKGINIPSTYHEKMNKHIKIISYLKKYWNQIVWSEATDPEYLVQITDYIEGQEPDDACFIAGTKVMTLFGNKNIENIKKGGYVLTPFGFRKVLACGCSGRKKVIKNIGLIGTPNHKIYDKVFNSFKKLNSLTSLLSCDILSLGGIIKWKIKKLLFSMDKNIQRREDIIFLNNQIGKEKIVNNCIEQFGNFIIKGKYQKGMKFITKISTQTTMVFLIWNWLNAVNIVRCMLNYYLKMKIIVKRTKNNFLKQEKKQKNGIEVKREENGIKNILWNLLKKFGILEKKGFVSNVEKNIQQDILHRNIAQTNVETGIEVKHMGNIKNVKYAEKKYILQREEEQIQGIVQQNANGWDTKKKEKKEKVYNLKIAGVGVYYANNILVSNCDSAASLLRGAFYKSSDMSLYKL